MKNQKGFSLVELLVVVIIIAIIAAIAIPSLLASRRAANEASAINTLRTIHSAEVTYQAVSGGGDDFADGSLLTGLVDTTLAADGFTKSGYTFVVLATAGEYCASALPIGTAGNREFGIDKNGVVLEGLTAAAPCVASGVLDDTGGTPIGN